MFLGRVDRQVKILGHRVEPDEVESVLSRRSRLDAVAVTAVEGAHGTELVAYVSPADSLSDASVQDAHVRRWGEVWESAYTAPPADGVPDDGAEFAGWLSSYTGGPIPVPEMREWLGHTVDRIRALDPHAMADIGVGVGLVLRSLAEQVRRTTVWITRRQRSCPPGRQPGTSLAGARTTRAVRARIPRRPGAGKPRHGGHQLRRQYFPGTDYLRTVLTDAVRAVRPGGAVFVGDVRSVDMLPEFHTAVQLHRAGPLQTVEELRSAISRNLREERELCLSPAFFHRLADELDGIGEVRIELKRGAADNELSLFRYDVTLLVGDQEAAGAPRSHVRWDALDGGLDGLRKQLETTPRSGGDRHSQPEAAARHGRGPGAGGERPRGHRLGPGAPAVGPGRDGRSPSGGAAHLAADEERQVRALVPQDGRLDTFDAVFDRILPAHDDAEDKA